MPARRKLTMRHLRGIMRLHHEDAGAEVARDVGLPRSTVQDALRRATAARLTWPLPVDVTDEATATWRSHHVR